MARDLVIRAKSEVSDVAIRANLIELIETVIIYKLPRLSREEIQTMLQVHDIRETRVYQEAKEEGIEEGIKKGTARAIVKLAARKMSPEEIAVSLEVNLELVREVLSSQTNGSH